MRVRSLNNFLPHSLCLLCLLYLETTYSHLIVYILEKMLLATYCVFIEEAIYHSLKNWHAQMNWLYLDKTLSYGRLLDIKYSLNRRHRPGLQYHLSEVRWQVPNSKLTHAKLLIYRLRLKSLMEKYALD